MNETTGTRPERRRFPRIAPKGTLLAHATGHAQRGRIANLGSGGAFVLTRVTLPAKLLGAAIGFEIRLDSGRAAWLRGGGHVTRIVSDGFAIQFDAAIAPIQRMVDEQTRAASANARTLSVVLVDADAGRRAAIAAGFRATGCAVVEAATPLEAIVRLGESSFEPDMIAIARAAGIDEMRTFVEREHPRARLVMLDDLLEPDGISRALVGRS
jgi:hypothetical protein